ncbi:hypothetical protein PED39_02425 [Methanomassiliicoccales archaeon LGM-RCC1]|nr:hypothetical protein PED39_02425 [Methanomassiliicoccales archaeon LGM-RCC1]
MSGSLGIDDIMKNQRAYVKNPNNKMNKAARDNRANQLNPNNKEYWKSRGYIVIEKEE